MLTQVDPYIFQSTEGKNTTIKNLKYQDESITIRRFLQIFATDIMRKHFGDNFWVNYLFNKHDKECYYHDELDNYLVSKFAANLIIHDVTFKNEADSIKESGILIRLNKLHKNYTTGSFLSHITDNTQKSTFKR